MKVKFIYPFKDLQSGWEAELGSVHELKYLSHDKAIFSDTFPMALNLFFKITEPVNSTAPRSKPKTYPKNIEEQFEILWQAKGKKGAKTKAYTKYKAMLLNESEETCEALTGLLVAHIESSMNEIGFPELHLTTYLNQERWEQ